MDKPMNTKIIDTQSPAKAWASFGRIINDKKSASIIEAKLNRKRVTDGDLYRLQVVASGIVFGQVMSGGF